MLEPPFFNCKIAYVITPYKSTNTGAVFSWGENDSGQLGYYTTAKQSLQYETHPRKVEQVGKHFVIDVACGEHHSCIVTQGKEVYVWGSNKDG
jgi:alpha-tubulin suppressor-like RCC1 family protein